MTRNPQYLGGPTGNWPARIRLVKEYIEEDGVFMDEDTCMERWGCRKRFIRDVFMQIRHRVPAPRSNIKIQNLKKDGLATFFGNLSALVEYGMTEEDACRAMGIRPEDLNYVREREAQKAARSESVTEKLENLAAHVETPQEREERLQKKLAERQAKLEAKIKARLGVGMEAGLPDEERQEKRTPTADKLRGKGQNDYAKRIMALKVSNQTAGWLANMGWWNIYADDEPIRGRLAKLAKGFNLKRPLDGVEALDALERLGWPKAAAVNAVCASTVERGLK